MNARDRRRKRNRAIERTRAKVNRAYRNSPTFNVRDRRQLTLALAQQTRNTK